ncbi:hypothetical protein SDC9_140180 [bioreactor metagenome]|uniref:Uncharacterized protein n=1 Tax=bioreactor metagenome TaxID=1076179 RepID=A0A645DU50_9ZZZZ
MAAELLGVFERPLESVHHAADCIKRAAGKHPGHSRRRHNAKQRHERDKRHPAHAYIKRRRQYARLVEPEERCEYSGYGQSPDYAEHAPAPWPAKHNEAYGSIGPGDKNKYHAVVHFAEGKTPAHAGIHAVIQAARKIQRRHRRAEHRESNDMPHGRAVYRGRNDKPCSARHAQGRAYSVSQRRIKPKPVIRVANLSAYSFRFSLGGKFYPPRSCRVCHGSRILS